MQKIKLTIFSRLVFGYFVIFILAMSVSVYSILQLHKINEETSSILLVANRFVDIEENLTNAFQAVIRHEKGFIATKDEAVYDRFLRARDSFESFIDDMLMVAATNDEKGLFMRIKGDLKHYEDLFDEEVEYLANGQDYPAERYMRDKESDINKIMEVLHVISSLSQKSYFSKIEDLDDSEVRAIKIAVGMMSATLVLLLLISIFITFNISRPLSAIERKTGDIARGDFGDDLKLSSLPEVAELAKAFNIMSTRLKQLDRMKSDFYSSMSHELRTPLTSIKEGGNLLMEGLKENDIPAKYRRLLAIIVDESDRMIKLVNNLLDSSKIEASMMTYRFAHTDIASLIYTVVREVEPLAETGGINVETMVAKGLPYIEADRERVLQVLRNLVGNALKFTPKNGSITISAEAAGKGVKVAVSDTGVGLHEDELESIFDKFQQNIHTYSGKIEGVGLGLSLSKHIVEAHGGSIRAENREGGGSTFSFILPV